MEVTPESIVEFWFSPQVQPMWFNSTPAFDAELRDRYEGLWQQAKDGELQTWSDTPLGALALAIILDQFPLNMFRGQAASFSTEAASRQVAAQAIEKGLDQHLGSAQKVFLYLPYMHSESMPDQDRSVELFEQAGLAENVKYAKHHRDIVKRFGRFPHRNVGLGRASTAEEIAWLNSDEAFKG